MKNAACDRLIRLAERNPEWVLGFQDETWWSRLARPDLHAWASGGPLRLHQPAADAEDPDPKALACYGLLRADTGRMMLRFVAGRPVSQVTEDFLAWACERLARIIQTGPNGGAPAASNVLTHATFDANTGAPHELTVCSADVLRFLFRGPSRSRSQPRR